VGEVGVEVGMVVGRQDGRLVGRREGTEVGSDEGWMEGNAEGWPEGDDGWTVGWVEGVRVGLVEGCWVGWPVGNIVGMTFVTPMWIAVYPIIPTDCSNTFRAFKGHTNESMSSVTGQFLANALLHLVVGTVKSGWLMMVNITVVLGIGYKHVIVIVCVSLSALPVNPTI
jgi:hypothetical protein